MWSFDLLHVSLIVLTVTFFILTLYAIVQENLSLLSIEPTDILSFKILDPSSSASLFVTLVGALLVRHQFVLGLRPRLGYKSIITTKQNAGNNKQSCEVWQVSIQNVGLGAAIVDGIYFRTGMSAVKDNPFTLTQNEVIKELAKYKLIHGQDYWLENISVGFTLPHGENYVVLEIKTEHRGKLKQLDALISFRGFLGDKYHREVFFIPRNIATN